VQVGATVEYAGRMRGNREDGDFAQSRFFELTGLDHANPLDAARSALLADLMRQRVFAVNRTQKGLGYVHGAHLFRGAEITLGFYGEARGTAEEQAEIARGWANAIAWTQAISPELRAAFERSREGLLARLQEKKGPAEAAVADLDALGRGAELDFNAKLVEAMRVLTLEDVVRTAQNRLGPDRPYLDVRLFGGTPGGRLARACSGFFVAEAGAASAGGPASKASSISGARAALRARR
jgi:secreted Zn-dependent insulinase-like peptidase